MTSEWLTYYIYHRYKQNNLFLQLPNQGLGRFLSLKPRLQSLLSQHGEYNNKLLLYKCKIIIIFI